VLYSFHHRGLYYFWSSLCLGLYFLRLLWMELHPWNEITLIMVYDFLMFCWIWFASTLLRTFVLMFIKEIGPEFSLCALLWFWNECNTGWVDQRLPILSYVPAEHQLIPHPTPCGVAEAFLFSFADSPGGRDFLLSLPFCLALSFRICWFQYFWISPCLCLLLLSPSLDFPCPPTSPAARNLRFCFRFTEMLENAGCR
jgi:hypothetical protein